jgi:hypothetical protein
MGKLVEQLDLLAKLALGPRVVGVQEGNKL